MVFSEKNKEQLLVPITDEAFCGIYIKDDKVAFRPLRNAFNVAQTSLRGLSQNPDANELEDLLEQNIKNWENIASQLLEVFKTSTRDAELIGWYLTAQIQLDPSLKGFTTCLAWLLALVEKHWNELHPLLPQTKLKSQTKDEQLSEQVEAKCKAFAPWLGDNEESCLFYTPLLNLPIIGNVTFFQYQSAELKGEVATLKQEHAHLVANERENILARLGTLHTAIDLIEKINKIAASHAQSANIHPPGFVFVKSLLTKFANAISHLTNVKFVQTPALTASVANDDTQDSDESTQENKTQETRIGELGSNLMTTTSQNFSQIAQTNALNRDIAFRQLKEISDYFRISEPHSPICFLLDKAIRWGYLPLPDLLKEMFVEVDSRALSQILTLTGMDNDAKLNMPVLTQPPPSKAVADDEKEIEDKKEIKKEIKNAPSDDATTTKQSIKW